MSAAFAAVGVLAQPAAAAHDGAAIDCGAEGTFTVRPTTNSGGFEAPPPYGVILLQEGGALTILEMSINGHVIYDRAVAGREANGLGEATCTFSLPNGARFEITGRLVGG